MVHHFYPDVLDSFLRCVFSSIDTNGEEVGDDSLTDDMNIAMQDKNSVDNKNSDTAERNIKRSGKNKGRKKHLKPPRRAPRTYDEKVLYIKCWSVCT